MHHPFRILLSPQGGEGGDPAPVPDLTKAIEGLLSRHGDPNAALRVLVSENYELRDTIRTLKGKVPPEGDVVLSGDDAKRWHTYRELGEPAEMRKAVSERDQLRAEAESYRRAESYAEAATRNNLNPKAFRRLAEQEKLQLEVREVRGQDGKITPVDHVKGVDDEGAETFTPLAEHIEKQWPEFLPALREGQGPAPQRSPSMPPRREPSPNPPPPGDGYDPAYRPTPAGPSVPRM